MSMGWGDTRRIKSHYHIESSQSTQAWDSVNRGWDGALTVLRLTGAPRLHQHVILSSEGDRAQRNDQEQVWDVSLHTLALQHLTRICPALEKRFFKVILHYINFIYCCNGVWLYFRDKIVWLKNQQYLLAYLEDHLL